MKFSMDLNKFSTNKIMLLKESMLSKDLIYYNIIFWPLIFTCSELMRFPSVLLVLISLILMMIYMWKNDINRFKFALTYFIIAPLIFQLIIFFVINLNLSFNLNRTSNLIKFNIRWMHLIVILFLFTNRELIRELWICSKKMVNKIFVAASIFMMIELTFSFFSIGYEYVWGGSYFKGPFYNTHVNSYFLIVPMISLGFCYFNLKDKRLKVTSFVLSTITVILNLMTGARTSSTVAIVLYFILFFSGLFKNKKLFIKIFLVTIALFIINLIFRFVDLTAIPLVKKTIMVLDDPSGFLNGRNYIWANMLKYESKHFNIINYLLGMGLGESFLVNYIGIRQSLWAHNDLLETFNGLGFYGVTIYCYIYFKYFKKHKNVILTGAFLILLFFNGLFTYSELVNFIPFITMVYMYKLKNNKEENSMEGM